MKKRITRIRGGRKQRISLRKKRTKQTLKKRQRTYRKRGQRVLVKRLQTNLKKKQNGGANGKHVKCNCEENSETCLNNCIQTAKTQSELDAITELQEANP